MKIKSTPPQKKRVTISEIKLGECFRFGETAGSPLYLKIPPLYTCDYSEKTTIACTAIRLESGTCATFSELELVYPVDTILSII